MHEPWRAEFVNRENTNVITSSHRAAVEPLSLAEAKAFLRVENSDDDDVISALIAGSRIHIEAQTRRALVTQSWRIALDQWPADGRLPVRPAPLQEVTAARVYDFQGNAQSLDLQAFVIDPGNSTLVFAPWSLAQPGRLAAGIEFDVVCGFGDAGSDVPEPLRQAIRLAGRALVRESWTGGGRHGDGARADALRAIHRQRQDAS